MRELVVRIKFTKHCLGDVRRTRVLADGTKQVYFVLPRTPDGHVTFLPTWWKANMSYAAEVLCRHQDQVDQIQFDMLVDGKPRPAPEQLYRRYYGPRMFAYHEAFWPGQVVGINVVVPDTIDDDSFRRLLDTAGRFRGISPARPREFGFFVVESLQRRMLPPVATPSPQPIETPLESSTPLTQ